MTIADKLQLTLDTKQAIKQALIDKGAEPSDVFSTYADEVRDLPSGDEVVGTIVDYRLDENAEGYLPCDGSLVNLAAYPELAPHLPTSLPSGATAPAGYGYLPKLPAKFHGNVAVQPLIRVENP